MTAAEAGQRLDKYLAAEDRAGSRRKAIDALDRRRVFVNGQEIETAETLQAAAAEQTRLWRFTIERDGRQMTQVLRY